MPKQTLTNGKVASRRNAVDAPIKIPPLNVDIIGKAPRGRSAAGKEVKEIMIPPIKTVRSMVTVRGISPLIVHAWSAKARKQMLNKQMGHASEGKQHKVPEEDFQSSRYLNKKGQDCVPEVALKSCAVEAGVICGAHKTTLRKAFFVIGPNADGLIPIESDPPVMREDMVRVGMGVADIRFRAEYHNWSIKIPVEFQSRLISAEQLFNLFDNAGYSVGIGEWRPEKDGQFGRFRVVLDR
jgi:hypothetical protein